MYLKKRKEKKRKDTKYPHYIPKKKKLNTPLTNGPILTLPLRMTTLISNQNYSPFLSRVTKGKSVK